MIQQSFIDMENMFDLFQQKRQVHWSMILKMFIRIIKYFAQSLVLIDMLSSGRGAGETLLVVTALLNLLRVVCLVSKPHPPPLNKVCCMIF